MVIVPWSVACRLSRVPGPWRRTTCVSNREGGGRVLSTTPERRAGLQRSRVQDKRRLAANRTFARRRNGNAMAGRAGLMTITGIEPQQASGSSALQSPEGVVRDRRLYGPHRQSSSAAGRLGEHIGAGRCQVLVRCVCLRHRRPAGLHDEVPLLVGRLDGAERLQFGRPFRIRL